MKEKYNEELKKLQKKLENLSLIEEILEVDRNFEVHIKYIINNVEKDTNLNIDSLKDLIIFSLAELRDREDEELEKIFDRIKHKD